MLKSALSTLMVFVIPATAVELAPHRASLCSAMLLAMPSGGGGRSTLQYYLNGLDGEVLEHLHRLEKKALSPSEKIRRTLWRNLPGELVERLFTRNLDFTKGHDLAVTAAFQNFLGKGWAPSNEKTIARLVGRLENLQEDFNDRSGQILSLGQVIRGADSIDQYFSQIRSSAGALESETNKSIYEKEKYAKALPMAKAMLGVTLPIVLAMTSTTELIERASNQDYLGFVRDSALYAYILPAVPRLISYGDDYFTGLYSSIGRNKFRNREVSRAAPALEAFDDMSRMARSTPSRDTFAYTSLNVSIPIFLNSALSESFNHPVPLDQAALDVTIRLHRQNSRLAKGSGSDPLLRKLLIDQILFFDYETNEPVLVNFVRIKRDISGVASRMPEH